MKKLCFILFFCSALYSQNPKIDQIQNEGDIMFQPSIVNYEDDIFIASTISEDFQNSTTGINIIRRNNSGTILWSKKYFNDLNIFLGSITVDERSKEIIVTGYLDDFHLKRLFVMVVNFQGDFQRSKVFSDGVIPNVNMYGTDIIAIESLELDNPEPCSTSSNYLISGFGSANSTHAASKFGFVLSIDKELNSISFFNKYDSNNITLNGNDFDSYNSVKEIIRNGERLYLITGSGVDNNGASMATIDLIDKNGISFWGNASGVNFITGSYVPHMNDTFGKHAIYNRYTDKIYIIGSVYEGNENGLGIIRINAATGQPEGTWHVHQHNFIPTGVEWYSEMEETFIVSNYTFNSAECSNITNFNTSFSRLNFNGNNVEYEVFGFNDDFYNLNYIQNILDLDLIINPVNYSNSNFTNQAYYTPKGLTRTNFYFESIGISAPGIANFSVHPIYLFENNCGDQGCLRDVDMATNGMGYYTNFSSAPGHIIMERGEILTENLETEKFSYCNPAKPEKFLQNKNSKNLKKDILIYPNPSKSHINIKNLEFDVRKNYNLRIIDINGKIIINTELKEMDNTYDISKLSSGIYIINIFENQKLVLNRKLIKE